MSSRYQSHRKARQTQKKAMPLAPLTNGITPPVSHRSRLFTAGMALLLITLCVVLYGRTVDFPMVFDDEMYLRNNPMSRDLGSFGYFSNFTEFANRPAALGLDPDLATNFVLRPVAYATFYLNYCLDSFNPRWYRAFNIAVHAANSVLIAGLLGLLLSRMGVARASRLFISFAAAALFAVHPLATESVTYIVQRFTSLGASFYLLALWLHFAAAGVESRVRRLVVRGAAALAVLLGMQTNESTFTAPLVAVMLDVALLRAPLKTALRRALPLLLCLPVIPVLVFAVSWAQHNGSVSWSQALNITNSKDQPWDYGHYMITQLTVVLSYLRRLIWPSGLNVDPSWPLHTSLLEWQVLRSLAVFGGLLSAGWWLFRRRASDARHALPLAFVAWFLVTLVPSSGLVPLPDLMAEHRCYLASIGVFVLAAWALDMLRVRAEHLTWARPALPVAAVLMVMALGAVTWQRNEVWRTPTALWEDTASKSPDKYRVWSNLAVAYSVDGRYEEALACSRKSAELEPRFTRALVQTASYLNALTRYREVIDLIRAKVTETPALGTLADIQYHYAVALLYTGSMEDGMRRLNAIIESVPQHFLSHIALGLIYKGQHRQDMALKHLRAAGALQPFNTALSALIAETEKQGELVAK